MTPSEKHLETARDVARTIGTKTFNLGEHTSEIERMSIVIADVLAQAERAGMKRAYLAGFNASCQGWNAEHPFQDEGRSPESDPEWAKERDVFLSEAEKD